MALLDLSYDENFIIYHSNYRMNNFIGSDPMVSMPSPFISLRSHSSLVDKKV